MTLGVGATGTVNIVPQSLEPAYGSRMPLGAVVFLRVRAVDSGSRSKGAMPGMTME